MPNLIDLFHSQPGILQEIERQLLAGGMNALLPGSGMAYNALRAGNKLTGNSLTNWLNGLGGSNSNPTQQFDPNVGGSPPVGPGTFSGDPTDPNNPGAYSSPYGPNSPEFKSAVQRASSGGRPTYAGSNNNAWNAWRSPFSQTYQQALNPGSAVGPFGGGITHPYTGQIVHPTHDTGASAIASAFSQYVNSRNIK